VGGNGGLKGGLLDRLNWKEEFVKNFNSWRKMNFCCGDLGGLWGRSSRLMSERRRGCFEDGNWHCGLLTSRE